MAVFEGRLDNFDLELVLDLAELLLGPIDQVLAAGASLNLADVVVPGLELGQHVLALARVLRHVAHAAAAHTVLRIAHLLSQPLHLWHKELRLLPMV